MRLRCAFGLHEWQVLSVEPWGHSTWHTWKVQRECVHCGRFDDFHERNKRKVAVLRAKGEK